MPLFASHAAFRARSDVEMVQQSPSIMMLSNKQSRSYKVRRSHGQRREKDPLTLVRLKIFICLERTVPAWVPLTTHRRSSARAAFQDLSKSPVAACVTATLALDKRLCSAAEPSRAAVRSGAERRGAAVTSNNARAAQKLLYNLLVNISSFPLM